MTILSLSTSDIKQYGLEVIDVLERLAFVLQSEASRALML